MEDRYKLFKEAVKIEKGCIDYFGKMYKLSTVEQWLKENEAQYSWIEDEIGTLKKPPITDAKFSRLVYLMSNTNRDEIDTFYKVGALLYNMPTYKEFLYIVRRYNQLRINYESYEIFLKDWCISYNSEYDYENIIELLDNANKLLEEIENTWLEKILHIISKGGQTIRVVLQQTILKCNYYIKKIASIRKEINGLKVEIPKEIEISVLNHKLQSVYREFEKKGKLNKVFKVIHKECLSILSGCSIDNKPLETKEQVRIVKLYVEQCSIEESLKSMWNNTMMEYKGIEINELSFEALSNIEEAINKLDIIINWDKKVVEKIRNHISKITFLKKIDWYSKETYSTLRKGILNIKYLNEYEELKNCIFNIKKSISKANGFDGLIRAMDTCNTCILEKYYKKLERLKDISPFIKELEGLMESLYEDCPMLVEKLLSDGDKLNLLGRYKNFSVAWKWRQFKNILIEVEKYKGEALGENNLKKMISHKQGIA